MNPIDHLAIIGSGASAIYLLKHLHDEVSGLGKNLRKISIFEKSSITGMGMPYSPLTTDRFNMSNISSEELPALTISFADWLREQSPETLEELEVDAEQISDSEVYSRLALGRYLNAQYKVLIAGLADQGIRISEHPGCEIVDIQDHPAEGYVTLFESEGETYNCQRVVIATGHWWAEEDRPAIGYYASPWPIYKLLPKRGEHHDFTIGTLGASLSAFDVITSLAHRHGDFRQTSGRLSYHPHPGTENFKIIMHSGHGLLPHLQYDQDEPFREIYRHAGRERILGLIDTDGYLRLETYFDQICSPALSKAFTKDRMSVMVKRLADPGFHFQDFVEIMTDKHDYENAFEGMRLEMEEAKESVLNHRPIHWKEVIDDLMYSLNFHAELMPAEDHLTLKSCVLPFLMNVVAAMPLPSGGTILALHDAGKLDMVSGKVRLAEDQNEKGMTKIIVEEEEKETPMVYRMFIDCSGQKPLELEEYPFHKLVSDGSVRKARASFTDFQAMADSIGDDQKKHLFKSDGQTFYHIGGIDIDGLFRLIGRDGQPNPRIYDIAFPHTSGVRPYSYGLQACSDTSAILVKSWVEEIQSGEPVENDTEEITQIYEEV